ncbi:MAG: hypothetical protein CO093_04760 [Alphaproteobacteria bacterium CG_4_9_14_3_um_filter_47_13]|nr:MAG: hypothetical protein CO093_04760 [Alphaproteobacteria bacterium CG_4_9_14_3_um_filter_47_13]
MNEQIIQAQTAVTSPDIAYPAKSRNYSIVSPFIDFLLVGGVSVFIIPFVMLPFWESAEHSLWLGFTAYCLIFVLNLPHFIHSYQLLYRGYFTKMGSSAYGRGTKIRMAISGVIAPAVLIVFLLFGASQPDSRMLGYGTNVMLFTLGWHYVKQGYGIMMALSVRKKVFFDKMEKHILLANAYIVWLYSWFSLNTNANTEVYYGVPFTGAGLPVSWREPVLILFLLWTVIAVTILIRKSDRHPVLCYNGLAAYFFAVYPWVLFAFAHPNIIIFIPALHSLQYILFVWKLVYERTKEELLKRSC